MAEGMHYEEKLVTLVAIIAFFMVTNITRKRFSVKFMLKLAVLIFGYVVQCLVGAFLIFL